MTHLQDIINLLKAQIATLYLGASIGTKDVVDYIDPAYLQKMYLFNKKVDVLFTVKEAQGLTSRFMQYVPHQNNVEYEIDVWCASKAPQLNTAYKNLTAAALAEVQRIFKANPTYGSEKSTRHDPHTKGNIQIYNSTVTVTKINNS